MYWNLIDKTVLGDVGWININMRCIEIYVKCNYAFHILTININMRCIEMVLAYFHSKD